MDRVREILMEKKKELVCEDWGEQFEDKRLFECKECGEKIFGGENVIRHHKEKNHHEFEIADKQKGVKVRFVKA